MAEANIRSRTIQTKPTSNKTQKIQNIRVKKQDHKTHELTVFPFAVSRCFCPWAQDHKTKSFNGFERNRGPIDYV